MLTGEGVGVEAVCTPPGDAPRRGGRSVEDAAVHEACGSVPLRPRPLRQACLGLHKTQETARPAAMPDHNAASRKSCTERAPPARPACRGLGGGEIRTL